MGPTILQREVLPPRQAPCELRDFVSEEAQARAVLMRAIWMSAALVGLASMVARMLEMGL